MSGVSDKKYLITQDLLSSVNWCLKAPTSKVYGKSITWQKKAFLDLQNKLNRVYGDMPIAAKQGIEFEQKVYKLANKYSKDLDLKCSEEFKKVLAYLKPFDFYQKLGETYKIKIDHRYYETYLYCKFDALKSNHIVDLKTTSNFKPLKYKNSLQHILYSYVAKIPHFTYVVVEWLNYPKINKVHFIDLYLNIKECKEILNKEILKTFNFLKETDLWTIYREKYCLY